MNTFEQTKAEILLRAKNAGACQTGYKAGLEAQNAQELLKVITDNFYWAHNNRVIDAGFLADNFSKEELYNAGIVLSGKIKTTEGRLYACDNASVEARDNASVEACDNASVEAYGHASVEACDNASVEARDNASVVACDNASVEACDNASVEACDNASVEAYGHASVEACDNASVEARDNASVVACDNASVEARDNAYVLDYTGNIRNPHNMAIIRDYNQDKIYVKKGAFEIVEAE